MIKYEIKGDTLPVVICYPEQGQTLCSENGAMSWMSPNMKMATNAGGFGKAMGRMFSGESLFLNEFTPEGGEGMIAFASSFPGSIVAYHVTPGNGIIVQKKGFLAMEKGMDLSTHLRKKVGASLFGGEGFIMQKISGDGIVFIEIDGSCIEYDLKAGESLILGTGYLAAMSETCTMEVEMVKGAKNVLFGGEGLFNTCVTGPGKVWVQSMPVVATAAAIAPYLPSKGN